MVSILKDLDRLHRALVASIHRYGSVLGRVRSPLVALSHLGFFSDVLARHVAICVHMGWHAEVPLSEALRDQLQQACNETAQWKGGPFGSQPLPELQCFSDGSDGSSGASSLGQRDVYGYFTNNDLSLHINQKEFEGAIYALRSYMMKNTTVHFWTDSTTLYHYLLKWGGRYPHLNQLICQL